MDKNIFELRKFVVPEVITGLDARLLIGRYVSHFGTKKPMIITDKIVSKQSWYKDITERIKEYTDHYIVFDDVSPNPRDYETMMGAEVFISNDCDLIIAIGGGSPIDCAKGISIVATNGGNILDYEGVDEVRLPGPPLICIPSTSGTAADVSQFAIICDTMNMSKKAIISKKVVPDLALIDPVPLMSMDKHLTACTGLDALTHAIEAYVSNAQSALTDVHALEAIRLINENIENAVNNTKDITTMFKMMLGSLQAGLAFSNASLGAVHALAHSLGGLFDLPHGECNSILLEHVIDINYGVANKRYREIARHMQIKVDGVSDDEVKHKLIKRIRTIRENVHIDEVIVTPKLSEDQYAKLIQNALEDPCMITNPVLLTYQEVEKLYERVLQTEK